MSSIYLVAFSDRYYSQCWGYSGEKKRYLLSRVYIVSLKNSESNWDRRRHLGGIVHELGSVPKEFKNRKLQFWFVCLCVLVVFVWEFLQSKGGNDYLMTIDCIVDNSKSTFQSVTCRWCEQINATTVRVSRQEHRLLRQREGGEILGWMWINTVEMTED